MRILPLILLSVFAVPPVAAETINLASQKYVRENCITTSSNSGATQKMTGDYTVSGTFSVPTPPLPPEE